MWVEGFEPVYDSDSKVLILGSFPSVKSREEGFYYGNKQNRFWKTLELIYGEKINDSILSKKQFLLSHRLALWDIVSSCDIEGSMDADIKNPIIAPIGMLLNNTNIETVLCNGKKSFSLFTANFQFSIKVLCLPSTSPANVRFNIELWKNALESYI